MDYRTRIYNQYASKFQKVPSVFDEKEAIRWGRAYDTYLGKWLPKHKSAAILDLGCGGGKLLHFLKGRGYVNIQGIDVSPEQVSLARQVTDNVIEGDAIDFLKEQKKRYDLITGLDIIEHFKKEEVLLFLDACYSALKGGGRLILQTPNAESPWGAMHRYNDLTHELAFNPFLLEKLLTLAGFSEIDTREAGPVVHGLISFTRNLLWKIIRICLLIWNLAETGSKGSGIYTRVFFITGVKKVE